MNSQGMKVDGQFGKLPEILTLVDFNLRRFIDSFLMGADEAFWTGQCGTPSQCFLTVKEMLNEHLE